jgi:hypothetical protein
LPMRPREDSRTRSMCDLLYTEAPGRRVFWWTTRASSGPGPSLLPSLRSVRTLQAFYCCPSSRARKIATALDDFSLSRLSRQSEPHEGGPLGDATASLRAMARATSPWTRANNDRFHNTPRQATQPVPISFLATVLTSPPTSITPESARRSRCVSSSGQKVSPIMPGTDW